MMASVYLADRNSPEPLGSICRAANIAMHEWNLTNGKPEGFDYRGLTNLEERDRAHSWVNARARELLGTGE